jgi:hypothetical protein
MFGRSFSTIGVSFVLGCDATRCSNIVVLYPKKHDLSLYKGFAFRSIGCFQIVYKFLGSGHIGRQVCNCKCCKDFILKNM